MRGVVSIMLAVVAAVLLTGMGGLGGQPAGRTPETSEEITVRLVDRQGVALELSQFSMDGEVYLEGDVGSGNLTVPLAKVKHIEFGAVRGELVPVTVTLKTGEIVELKLRKRADFYGNMGVGAYRVEAAEVRQIDFTEKQRLR